MGLKFALSMRQNSSKYLLSCTQHAKGRVIAFLKTVSETTTQKALLDKFPDALGRRERNHTI